MTDASPPSLRAERADAAKHGETGHEGHSHGGKPALVLAALGIVFGDIGTSPLYALRECIEGEHGVEPNKANILGLLSLIAWSLMVVVTVKYLTFVMRADNGGEGGTLALLALVPEKLRFGAGKNPARIGWIALLVLAGTSLLYGDGMITPAISVLSAVEGLEGQAHGLKPYIVPITCAILLGLFAVQKHGTAGIGRFFGPVMVVWFLTLGGLGAWHVLKNPSVLYAIDPRYAVAFFVEHKMKGFAVLGSVVLAVTGGETLYADMGHFGRGPIRIAWLGLVFPGLLLAYFGMGALVLANPEAAKNPFFALAPDGGPTYALVGLSTAATVIASQGLISGAFSLTQQAVQLGFFPRVLIKHTSKDTIGQIYVPVMNWLLAAVCILLVVSFKESSRLAAAYGIAVTGSMTITSIVFFVVVRETWGWSLAKAVPLLVFFLAFDLSFLGANTLKILDGGWVPILIGAVFFTMMIVWRRGRRILGEVHAKKSRPLDEFIADIGPDHALPLQARTSGTAVFLTSIDDVAPPALVHHVERVRVMHEHVIILTLHTEHRPFVPAGKRVTVTKRAEGVYSVRASSGFMQAPRVPELLKEAQSCGLECDLKDATYFLGRETILALPGGRMGEVEETIFAILSRNARHAGQYFDLPPSQVVEIGVQVDL